MEILDHFPVVVGAISAIYFNFSRILSSMMAPSTFFNVGILFNTSILGSSF